MTGEEPSPTITEGAFFRTPAPLPRGRHTVAREDVVAAQRERLLIAAAVLTGTVGYRHFGIRELCRTAGVSQSVFYDHFADKDDCVFAVYQRFIDVIADRLTSTAPDETPWIHTLDAFTSAYLDALALDPVVARACIVEMDALGAHGRELRRASIRQVARVIHLRWEARHPEAAHALSLDQVVAATHIIRQSAADALDIDPRADVRTLVPTVGPVFARALSPRL